jgi:transcriptional regulator with XRE-family HTH domain
VAQSIPVHPLAAVLEAQERTASWLARKTGKSPSYLTRVLQGERRPSADFKARAAEALGVPVSVLFPEQVA